MARKLLTEKISKLLPTKKIITEKNFTYRNIIRHLKPYIIRKKPKNILDLGSGVGTLDLFLASKGINVTGIDISTKAVNFAKKMSKKNGLDKKTTFIRQDLEKISSMNFKKKFDLIIVSEVLEHLYDDLLLLKTVYRKYSKKGTILFVSVPSSNAPLFKIGLAKNFDKRVGHLRRYTSEKISRIIRKCGFKIIEIHQEEGIIRNSLFIFPFLNSFVKFIRGPISDIVAFIDTLSIKILGASQIIAIAQK